VANPQKEDGYTPIAHEILEAVSKQPLNGTQFRILTVIWRYTYGFNRKEHELSLTFISKATEIHKQQVKREIDSLIELNVISVQEEPGFGKSRTISFNKDYSQWGKRKRLLSAEKSTVSESADLQSANPLTLQSANPLTKKERSKDNIKDNIYSVFDQWNTKKIIQHKTMTKAMQSAINARLGDKYDLKDILEAIDNYATILESNEHFFKYRWTVTDFMNPKNLDRFLTANDPFNNFRKGDHNGRTAPDRPNVEQMPEWERKFYGLEPANEDTS
jgi:phage replication O-like protein O